VQAILDQRAVDMCKHINVRLQSVVSNPVFKGSSSNHPNDSTLFSRSEDLRSGLEPSVEKARDYCTKAVTLYQGRQYTEQILEWCGILVDVLEVARQRDLSNRSGVTEDNVIKSWRELWSLKHLHNQIVGATDLTPPLASTFSKTHNSKIKRQPC